MCVLRASELCVYQPRAEDVNTLASLLCLDKLQAFRARHRPSALRVFKEDVNKKPAILAGAGSPSLRLKFWAAAGYTQLTSQMKHPGVLSFAQRGELYDP